MHLKQKATPLRKESESLLTRAWLDPTVANKISLLVTLIIKEWSWVNCSKKSWNWKKVFHPSISAENDSRWSLCALHALLSMSSFLLLTHYFFLLNSCKCNANILNTLMQNSTARILFDDLCNLTYWRHNASLLRAHFWCVLRHNSLWLAFLY